MLTKVLVADDHAVVRAGLRKLLDGLDGFEVVAEASDGRQAVELALAQRPDLVVMDVSMPRLNGIEATRRIVAKRPDVAVLVLSVHDSDHVVQGALRAGARGYVLKSDGAGALLRAVRAVGRRREPFFTPSVMHRVLSGIVHPGATDRAETGRLTPRETEVAQLIAEGASSKKAGAVLGISRKTVDTHRASVMRKLRLRTLSDLVRWAVKNNVIGLDYERRHRQ